MQSAAKIGEVAGQQLVDGAQRVEVETDVRERAPRGLRRVRGHDPTMSPRGPSTGPHLPNVDLVHPAPKPSTVI